MLLGLKKAFLQCKHKRELGRKELHGIVRKRIKTKQDPIQLLEAGEV